ncbi:MAG: hypothetical protein GY842_01920 [bacterium]|nr:hypothetical protein [bacterium]
MRRQLKKLVNRWAGPWGLEASVLGRINRIADDADRPLGEALVLLDWSVFEDGTRARESEEAHLKRLVEWGEALTEFRDHLAGEIDILETRFRHWLSIWERWRSRRQSPEHERQWDTFIAETRRTKRDEMDRAQGEIARLKSEVAELQRRLRGEEGSP